MKSFSFVIILLCLGNIDCSKSLQLVGGLQKTSEKSYFMVSIQRNGTQVCCGSIVATKWVLTASSCITENITDYRIRYGVVDCYSNYRIVATTRTIVDHKKSVPDAFSLLKVDKAFNRDVEFVVARLPSSRPSITAVDSGLVFAWDTVPRNTRNLLKYGLFNINEGQDIINNHSVTNYEFNAGGNGTGISQGNIGAPFTYGTKIIGIASNISTLDGSLPDIFYRVSEFQKWIKRTIRKTF